MSKYQDGYYKERSNIFIFFNSGHQKALQVVDTT